MLGGIEYRSIFRRVLGSLAGSIGSTLIGFVAAGVGALLRTIRDKLRERISVLDYIPPGLHAGIAAGTDTTDLTSYVAAALTAAAGKRLYAPQGTYEISEPLLPATGTTIFGDGMHATIFKQTGVVFGDTGTYYAAFELDDTPRVHFRDLAVIGENDPVQSLALGDNCQGIFIPAGSTATDVVIERCRFEYIFGHGVQNEGDDAPRTTVRNCVASNNGKNGLNVNGERHSLVDNRCEDNAYHGIEASLSYSVVSRNFCRSNDNSGIAVGGFTTASTVAPHNTVTDNICDENAINGISIADGTHYSTIRGNHCRKNGKRGISVTETTGTPVLTRYNRFEGNFCFSNGLTAEIDTAGILCSASFNSFVGNHGRDLADAGYAQENGIRIPTGTSDIDVVNNDFVGNTVFDYVTGTATNIVLQPLRPGSTFSVSASTFIGTGFAQPTVSPTQLTADVNDYDPSRAKVWRLTSDASRTITGIAGGSDGRTQKIINDGSFDIVIAHQNGGSTGGNRIITGTATNLTLAPGDIANLFYDGTEARWRVEGIHGVQSILRLSVQTTATGNVGTGEDNLRTFTLAGGAFSANGQGVRITAWGTYANNANAKTLKLYFGSQISSQALTANEAGDWEFTALVFRTASNAQDYKVKFIQEGTTDVTDLAVGTLTETDANSITIKCTGEATTNNDIVQEGLLVELIR